MLPEGHQPERLWTALALACAVGVCLLLRRTIRIHSRTGSTIVLERAPGSKPAGDALARAYSTPHRHTVLPAAHFLTRTHPHRTATRSVSSLLLFNDIFGAALMA